jgi:serine/threonine protein kinase
MTTPVEPPIHSQPQKEKPPVSTTLVPSEPHLIVPTAGALPSPNTPVVPQFPGYDIVGELGRGGMGVVYQAYDRKRQRTVALKTMQGIDARSLLRFKQEYRSLAGLNHDNLVTLYELVGDGWQWFFTMELIEGVSLLHYVRGSPAASCSQTTLTDVRAEGVTARGRPTPLVSDQIHRLRGSLAQLARGVCFLHESGKLHRDIKPGNVLVTAKGRVVLLDFGLAADIDRDQMHHSVHLLGTIAYMAPEQAARQPVSPASDWYSVGVMLYEALTGMLPFDGDSYEILHRKQHSDPPAPSAVAAGTPEDLSTLCLELLRRDPLTRPPGGEVLRRLSDPAPALGAGFTLTSPKRSRGDFPVQRLEVPLIGRQQHLQLLTKALEKTRCGQTMLVEVHGRSGAGKSALIQHFLNDLREDAQAVILSGRCYELESVPYKALDSLIDALSAYLDRLPAAEVRALMPRNPAALARVFPVLRRLDADAGVPRRLLDISDPQELRRRALAALRELLARLGDRRTLILVIDDVQWADEDSAALLTDLLRPPEAPVLLLVLCYRREDSQSSPCLRALATIRDLGGLARYDLPVEPLTLEERRELAIALLDPHDDTMAAQAESIARQSGGYPFFVYELVQYLRDLGEEKEEREKKNNDDSLPPSSFLLPPVESGDISLSKVLWSRIVALPEEARRLLEVVAVASRPLAQADACRAADIADEHTVLSCLRAGRLLRGIGSSSLSHPGREGDKGTNAIETYHDRIRETVLLHLDAQTLQRHHQRLVAVLQASERVDPEVLAVHLVGAGESSRAGHYYALAAAQAAETLAFDRAAKLYRLAFDLLAPQGEEERRLRTQLGDALANAGRGAESARAYLSAACGAEASASLELQRNAALQFLRSGHIDDGLATLRTVLASIGLKLQPTPRRAFWALVGQRLRLMLRGLRFRPRTLDRINPAELKQLDICQSAAIGLSMVDTLQGAYFQTRSTLLALKLGEKDRLVTALAMEAAHTSAGGSRSRRRTQHYLDAVESLARQVNRPYAQAMVSLARGIAAALAGDWRDGQRYCDEAEHILRDSCIGALWELGTAHRFALWPLMFMGDVVEINRRLPRLLQEARQRDDLYEETNLCLAIRTFVRLAADEPQRARVELAQVMEKWSHQGFHVQHMNHLFDEAQLDLYGGDAERAWRRLAGAWPTLHRSHLLHVQQVRTVMLDLRARCALARAAGKDSFSWLRLAERDARRLRREISPWADALAQLVEAAIAFRRGDAKRSEEILNAAIHGFSTSAMHLHSAVARCRMGQMLGNSRGLELMRQAKEWMNGQMIRNCDRMTDLLAPGWNISDKRDE